MRTGCSFERGFKLNEDDIIKFGSIKYQVKEINCNTLSTKAVAESTGVPNSPAISLNSINVFNEDGCRICRTNSNTDNNPLMSICRCSGSIKFVHAECIKTWHRNKLTITKAQGTTTYAIKRLECELCKTQFPLTIVNEGRTINLIEIEKPTAIPYIILESLNETPSTKYVHVISTTISVYSQSTVVKLVDLLI